MVLLPNDVPATPRHWPAEATSRVPFWLYSDPAIYRLEQEILVEEPGIVSYAVWHKGFVGEYYRCADCGELHSQFDEDGANELRLDDLDPPEER